MKKFFVAIILLLALFPLSSADNWCSEALSHLSILESKYTYVDAEQGIIGVQVSASDYSSLFQITGFQMSVEVDGQSYLQSFQVHLDQNEEQVLRFKRNEFKGIKEAVVRVGPIVSDTYEEYCTSLEEIIIDINGMVNPDVPEVEETKLCTDSDDGWNYFQKGYTNAGVINSSDYCFSEDVLVEFGCGNPPGITPTDPPYLGFGGWISTRDSIESSGFGKTTMARYGFYVDLVSVNSDYATFELFGKDYDFFVGEGKELGDTGMFLKLNELSTSHPSYSGYPAVSVSLANMYSSSKNIPCKCKDGSCILGPGESLSDFINGIEINVSISANISYDRKTNNNQERKETTMPGEEQCRGCYIGGTCYDIGFRRNGIYCDASGKFFDYLKKGSDCSEHFQCVSGFCIENKCVTKGFFDGVVNWFKGLFGN